MVLYNKKRETAVEKKDRNNTFTHRDILLEEYTHNQSPISLKRT